MAEISNELTPNTSLQGEQAYQTAIDLIIENAQHELLIFDQDLSLGGYSTNKRYEALRTFLAKNRLNRLVIVLHDPQYLLIRCPRLMGLLKIYNHAVSVHVTDEQLKSIREVFVIADHSHYVQRFHVDEARFIYALDNPIQVKPLNMKFAELLKSSSETVSATTSGL